MINSAEQINKHISGRMRPEDVLEFKNSLEKNEALKEQYRILLNAREYIKAKLALEEIENDPDLSMIMDQVINHFESEDAKR